MDSALCAAAIPCSVTGSSPLAWLVPETFKASKEGSSCPGAQGPEADREGEKESA